MDQRSAYKMSAGLEVLEDNTTASIQILQHGQQILHAVDDLLQDDRSDGGSSMGRVSGAADPNQSVLLFGAATTPRSKQLVKSVLLTNGTNGATEENDSPNAELTPMSLAARKHLKFSSNKKMPFSAGSFLSPLRMEQSPADAASARTSTAELGEDDEMMSVQSEQNVIQFTAQSGDEVYELEVDLSTPEYCREAVRQSDEMEETYRTKFAKKWADDEQYQKGYYSKEEYRVASYYGSVHITVPYDEFERRIPPEDVPSLLGVENELQDDTHSESDLLHLSIPVYLPRRRSAGLKADQFEMDRPIRGYKIFGVAGTGTFSQTFACEYTGEDASIPKQACVKMIKSGVDGVLEQALAEISVLTQLRDASDAKNHRIVRLVEYFYYDSNLFIVEDLHHDNLYDVMVMFKSTPNKYFTESNLKLVARQVLEALAYVHSHGIIHTDIKPENILLTGPTHLDRKPDCVLIDFGSAKYKQDPCSDSYIQSRPYRAPEVILGAGFKPNIDVWSVGCILAELFMEELLFSNASVPSMLAQIISICGPLPDWMIEQGRVKSTFFRHGLLYEVFDVIREGTPSGNDQSTEDAARQQQQLVEQVVRLYFPKPTSLRARVRSEDKGFIAFLETLLVVDSNARVTAEEALRHPWL